jgi:10 TM Acyl Transferase domain found in Cas1p
LEAVCKIHWRAPEWRFRVNLDIFIVYAGMLTAIAYGKSREVRLTSHPKWTWIHRSSLTLSGVGLIWWFFFELTRKDKFAYNSWHPFVSVIPVVAFVLLRNATPVLRANSSWLYAFVGTCSLETFILQYHMWLAAGAIPTPGTIGSANKSYRYQRHSHHGTRRPLVDTTQLCCDFYCVYLDQSQGGRGDGRIDQVDLRNQSSEPAIRGCLDGHQPFWKLSWRRHASTRSRC